MGRELSGSLERGEKRGGRRATMQREQNKGGEILKWKVRYTNRRVLGKA